MATCDMLTHVRKLKEAGFIERQAEAQALMAVVETNLATQHDIELLRRDMKELASRLVRHLGSRMIVAVGALCGSRKDAVEARHGGT